MRHMQHEMMNDEYRMSKCATVPMGQVSAAAKRNTTYDISGVKNAVSG